MRKRCSTKWLTLSVLSRTVLSACLQFSKIVELTVVTVFSLHVAWQARPSLFSRSLRPLLSLFSTAQSTAKSSSAKSIRPPLVCTNGKAQATWMPLTVLTAQHVGYHSATSPKTLS